MLHPGVAGHQVLADQELAVARPVQLDARIAFPAADSGHVAEEHAAPRPPQDLSGPGMVARVIAEGLGRTARAYEGLRDPERCPRLGAARPENERHLQGDGRHPQRVHPWRIARQHDAERIGPRIETEDVPLVLAMARVEDGQIEPARQPAQHGAHLAHHAGHALHVAAHQRMRHPGRRRQLQDVVVRRLLAASERQRVVEKMISRLRAHVDQRVERQSRELFACRRQPLGTEIAANQAGVGLTDLDERLARTVVRHADHVEALIGDALPEDGEVKHLGVESMSIPKLQLPTPKALPTAKFQGAILWELGVGSALEIGSWSLGVNAL